MRFLADECVAGPIVRLLRSRGCDIDWILESAPALEDEAVLARSNEHQRILVTQDWGFGALVIRERKPTAGLVIVATLSFSGTLDEIAEDVVKRIVDLAESLLGSLTVIEPRRTRQRRLE